MGDGMLHMFNVAPELRPETPADLKQCGYCRTDMDPDVRHAGSSVFDTHPAIPVGGGFAVSGNLIMPYTVEAQNSLEAQYALEVADVPASDDHSSAGSPAPAY